MIEILFRFGPEIILVRIEGTKVLFGNTMYGARLATIEGLALLKAGVEKEFPDLIGDPFWREEAINRFKEKIRDLKDENARAKYIIEDLKKHGYIAKKMNIAGRRSLDI